MIFQVPKGTFDIFGKKAAEWKNTEDIMRKVSKDFNINEIRTPTFEYADLFVRSVGETTDIVTKEMFRFTDLGGRVYALKPEGTAGVARSFIENGMANDTKPTKLFYITSSFRAERPQKGRYIELHQYGVEYIGSKNPAADAELISIAYEVINRLGIDNTVLHINSIGCNDCRAAYNKALKDFVGQNIDLLCADCRERFIKNPLRILDCKVKSCKDIMQNAPNVLDSLDAECTDHFNSVLSFLDELEIPYVVDKNLVRGLDYYTRTVFEFICDDLGSQSTVCAGGRYDNLIEECGGNPTPAVGFGMGIDRVMLVLEEQNKLLIIDDNTQIFIGSMGANGEKKALKIAYGLRKLGIKAECDTMSRSTKAQMKYADKLGAKFSMIIGDNEIESDLAKIKNMETGETTEIKICTDDIAALVM